MADSSINVLPSVDGASVPVSTDLIAGVHHQKQKVTWGPVGTANHTADVDGQRIPVGGAQIGATNETAPATDTAAAGLNGRLQRIAQRLTSIIALLPSVIGQRPTADSLSVVLAASHPAITVQGAVNATEYTEDAAAPSDPTGTARMLRFRATPAVESGVAAGDWVAQNGNDRGESYTATTVIDTVAAAIGPNTVTAEPIFTHTDTTSVKVFTSPGGTIKYVTITISHATDPSAMVKVNVNASPSAGTAGAGANGSGGTAGNGKWMGCGTFDIPVTRGLTVATVNTMASVSGAKVAVSFVS